MTITAYNSIKIRWLSFVAILCVVLGHCVPGTSMSDRVVMALFAQWHVPWFYMVSGMMLALSIERHTFAACMRARLRSLVIPYFLWLFVGFLIAGVQDGAHADIWHWFGINTAFPAGNPHLWYLHCLIVFSMTSLLVWHLVCCLKICCPIIVFAVIYGGLFGIAMKFGLSAVLGTPTSPFYFLLGFMVARYVLPSKGSNSSGGICVAFVVAAVLRCGWFTLGWQGMPEQILRAACVVSQFSVLWVGYDFIVCRLKRVENVSSHVPWYVGCTFFIYCAHGFILNLLKQFNMYMMTILFVGTVSLTLMLAWLMRRFLPGVFAILTGGRR